MSPYAEGLLKQLELWPGRIRDSDVRLAKALEAQEDAERELELARDRLYATPGSVTGKNAEEREACVRTLTRGLLDRVLDTQQKVRRERVRLRWAENAFAAARSQVKLLTNDSC